MASFACNVSICGADVESSVPAAVAVADGADVVAVVTGADVVTVVTGADVVAVVTGADVVAVVAGGADTPSMCRSSGFSSASSSLQTTSHQPIVMEGNNTH